MASSTVSASAMLLLRQLARSHRFPALTPAAALGSPSTSSSSSIIHHPKHVSSSSARIQRRCYSARPPDRDAASTPPYASGSSAASTSTSPPPKPRKKVTIRALHQMFMTETPISVITAYDYPTARFAEEAGVDICLVGDSLAMVSCGYSSTTEIGMDEMLYHCRSVSRGAKTPFLLADMPFGSHEPSLELGVTNALRLMREGGMEAVKIEGGKDVLPLVTRLVDIGVPVMGHVGLTPQRVSALSGFRIQGKTAESALRIVQDARALQAAGAFAILLEAVPAPVADFMAADLKIPIIGIGATSACGGQVLVQPDMLGVTLRVPKFCKTYANLGETIPKAIEAYVADVKARKFPEGGKHTYDMPDEERRRFMELSQDLPPVPDTRR